MKLHVVILRNKVGSSKQLNDVICFVAVENESTSDFDRKALNAISRGDEERFECVADVLRSVAAVKILPLYVSTKRTFCDVEERSECTDHVSCGMKVIGANHAVETAHLERVDT